ncbi:3-oxoadipate enol-lactonase [Tateyamaria sp.]|uniref:3-oxoadipate enol-lactonase n=1 Tax=Tateyamaria sp. TaxID=1929288 RepID=UPI003B219907
MSLASGVTLNTAIDGQGADKPWIILSNSLGANLAMWEPQIAFLTSKYQVLRYDTRGHGASEAPDGPYVMSDLVADVIGLMDAKGIETAEFMGLSMGGMTGLGLALQHGDRITRVVCADGRADAPEPFRDMWDQRIAAVFENGLDGIADGTLMTWFTEDWRTNNPIELAGIKSMILGNDPAGYIACCKALKGLDYLKDLGTVTIPVLFVGGSDDKGAAPGVMQAMADATPGGVFHEVADAAHVANINQPDAFNKAVAGFLGL